MSSDFLNDFSFEELIRPTTSDVFFKQHWGQRPLFLERHNENFYGDLVTVSDIDHLVTTAPSRLGLVQSSEDGIHEYQVAQSAVELSEFVYSNVAHGSTLVARAEDRLPALGLLCRLLAKEFGFVFEAGIYVSPSQSRAFRAHFDKTDVFVLQLFGSKMWHVEKTRRSVPRLDEYDQGDTEMAADKEKILLRQGDLLYLPRGFVHAAFAQDETSVHLVLRTAPPTWEDLLHAAVKVAADENEALKMALPVGLLAQDSGALAAVLEEFLGTIRSRTDLDRTVSAFLDEQVTRFATDTAGQIQRVVTGERSAPGDRVGPRRGLIYRRHVAGEDVVLLIGSRRVTFPDVLLDQLDYALETPAFAVRDIPGDLSDDEKVVFVERLMQEGIIELKDDVI
jgi:ribosomal protein L16 Arg81 hydroxylase